MKISFPELKNTFESILLKIGFSERNAERCASIFADNTVDGVYSHGVNRFPVFVEYVKEGLIKVDAEPRLEDSEGFIERYDGNLGPGMLNASFCMERAIKLSNANGISCVSIRNTNHWMRGGTYGWQAANVGCIGICFTNTIANMPPWGGIDPRLGNNPLVISVPREEGHVVLDMAMTQYSFGKLQEYELRGDQLPFPGGYDKEGNLSLDPAEIKKTERTLPIGFWKGSGLSLMLDLLATVLTKGKSTKAITDSGKEFGVSQVFICIKVSDDGLTKNLIEEILTFTKSSRTERASKEIYYPGERTLLTRRKNMKEGIPVDDSIWEKIMNLNK